MSSLGMLQLDKFKLGDLCIAYQGFLEVFAFGGESGTFGGSTMLKIIVYINGIIFGGGEKPIFWGETPLPPPKKNRPPGSPAYQ